MLVYTQVTRVEIVPKRSSHLFWDLVISGQVGKGTRSKDGLRLYSRACYSPKLLTRIEISACGSIKIKLPLQPLKLNYCSRFKNADTKCFSTLCYGHHSGWCFRVMRTLGIIFFVSGKKKFVFSPVHELNRIFRDNLVKKGFKYWQMMLKNTVITAEQIKTVSIWHQTSGWKWKKLVEILDVLFTWHHTSGSLKTSGFLSVSLPGFIWAFGIRYRKVEENFNIIIAELDKIIVFS